jgi:uncharacterized NTF2-like protein DUF6841
MVPRAVAGGRRRLNAMLGASRKGTTLSTGTTHGARSDLRDEVIAFFDTFVVAFRTFDGSHIAQRYAVPYLALNTEGTAQCFADHAEIGRYFQSVVDNYRVRGCRSCRYKDLEVLPLGHKSGIGTVTWELLREDGSVLSVWRESYVLTRTENGLRILASVDHVG